MAKNKTKSPKKAKPAKGKPVRIDVPVKITSGKVRSLKNMVEWDPKKKIWKDLITGEIIVEGKTDLIPRNGDLPWETGVTDTPESLARMNEKLRQIADETEPTLKDVVDPRVDSAAVVVGATKGPRPGALDMADIMDVADFEEEEAVMEPEVNEVIRRFVTRLVIDALR